MPVSRRAVRLGAAVALSVVTLVGLVAPAGAETIVENRMEGGVVGMADGWRLFPYGSGETTTFAPAGGGSSDGTAVDDDGRLVLDHHGEIPARTATNPWWDTEWKVRQCLTVVNDGAELVDQAVVTTIDTAAWIERGELESDGADLRATLTDGTELPIAAIGDLPGDATEIWVRVPVVAAGSAVVLCIYGGNPAATSVLDPTVAAEPTVAWYPLTATAPGDYRIVAEADVTVSIAGRPGSAVVMAAGESIVLADLGPTDVVEATGPIVGAGLSPGAETLVSSADAGDRFLFPAAGASTVHLRATDDPVTVEVLVDGVLVDVVELDPSLGSVAVPVTAIGTIAVRSADGSPFLAGRTGAAPDSTVIGVPWTDDTHLGVAELVTVAAGLAGVTVDVLDGTGVVEVAEVASGALGVPLPTTTTTAPDPTTTTGSTAAPATTVPSTTVPATTVPGVTGSATTVEGPPTTEPDTTSTTVVSSAVASSTSDETGSTTTSTTTSTSADEPDTTASTTSTTSTTAPSTTDSGQQATSAPSTSAPTTTVTVPSTTTVASPTEPTTTDPTIDPSGGDQPNGELEDEDGTDDTETADPTLTAISATGDAWFAIDLDGTALARPRSRLGAAYVLPESATELRLACPDGVDQVVVGAEIVPCSGEGLGLAVLTDLDLAPGTELSASGRFWAVYRSATTGEIRPLSSLRPDPGPGPVIVRPDEVEGLRRATGTWRSDPLAVAGRRAGSTDASAELPDGTTVRYRVAVGPSVEDAAAAVAVGPDGSADTWFEGVPTALPVGLDDAAFAAVEVEFTTEDPLASPSLVEATLEFGLVERSADANGRTSVSVDPTADGAVPLVRAEPPGPTWTSTLRLILAQGVTTASVSSAGTVHVLVGEGVTIRDRSPEPIPAGGPVIVTADVEGSPAATLDVALRGVDAGGAVLDATLVLVVDD